MPTDTPILGINGAVWLRILFLIAAGVFVWRIATLAKVLQFGRRENRLEHIPVRVKTFLREVIGQRRLFQEPVIGWAHPMIFWGFCFFILASTLMLIGGMFPSSPVPQVEQIPILGTLVDMFALLVLVGLAAAGVRRYIFTPKGLERTYDASIILVLIAGSMVTFVVAEAGEGARDNSVWLPVGAFLQGLMESAGVTESGILAIGHAAWWLHVIILLVLLVYVPFSKHMHLIWAPFNVFFAEQPAKGLLLASESEAAESGNGDPLHSFTWKMLLNAYSCAECGRCERVCPAAASGSKLSPKELMHEFKQYVFAHGLHGGNGHSGDGNGHNPLLQAFPQEVLWGCTTCYACVDRCPVRNEHVPVIVEMRRKLLEEGVLEDNTLQDSLMSLQRYGNSQQKSPRKRFAWSKELATPLTDARKTPVETLWFVGDYAAFHPACTRVSQMVAEIFQAAELDFGVLFEAERSAGNDVRRVGEEGLYEMLAEQNMKAFEKAEFQSIVTTDPHTYHALKHDYRTLGLDYPVSHYTEVIAELLENRKLIPLRPVEGRAVYHDPCYLGRINGIYEPPRKILDSIGMERVEMPRTRENSFCCGAGGGKMWMEDEPGVEERPAVNRIREALAMDGVTHFVTACPKDLAMFEDALKTAGGEDRLRVVDIGEYVYEAVGAGEREGVTA